MSRIGKKIIILPAGVQATISDGSVTVKGPRGSLSLERPAAITASVENNSIVLTPKNPDAKKVNALWGLTRALIQNMVTGVTTGYSKSLEINGVGFKATLQSKKLVLQVGFSHPVEYQIPESIEASIEKNVITLKGSDKQLVGQVAAEIRGIKPPEPYKGKGIKYSDETIRRKEGKVVKSTA